MADFGLYTALRGQEDWKTKRADAMMTLGVAQQRKQDAQQATQQSMQIEEGMNAAFDAMANLDVLTQDSERIQALEKEKRKTVIQGIAKYNGDLKKYMASGGITDLHGYKNSILQSDQYKQAVGNKINLQNYMTDRSKDLRAMMVTVDVPITDPTTGEQMMKPTKMSMEEQVKLFNDGKIEKLNYQGAEKKVNLGIEDFSQLFKDPLNPYGENSVTESDIYKKVLSKQGSDEYARERALEYGNMIKQGGDVWKWNAKDPAAYALEVEKLRQKQQIIDNKRKAAGSSGGGQLITNLVGSRIAFSKPGTRQYITGKERELYSELVGIQKMDSKDAVMGGKFKWQGDAMSPDLKMTIPMGTGEIRQLGELITGTDGKMYISATVGFDDDDPAVNEGLMWDQAKKGLEHNFMDEPGSGGTGGNWFSMGSTMVGEVLIPVDKQLRDMFNRVQLNKDLDVRTNQTNPAADFDQEADVQNALEYEELLNSYGE